MANIKVIPQKFSFEKPTIIMAKEKILIQELI